MNNDTMINPAAGKNLAKNKYRWAIYALVSLLVAGLALFILPDWIGVGLLFFIAKHKAAVGYTVLALAACFVGYLLIQAKQPQVLKRRLLALLSAPAVAYAAICLYAFLFPTHYDRCDYYNKELNGGVREFNGQKYTIELCGTGGDEMQSNDVIRLQVFDGEGKLAAQRHFIVNWNDSGFPKALEYHPDHITYYDNTGKDFDKQLFMPPSAVEWIRARLPLMN